MRDHAELELMLKGYGLTTAEILYHLPDHPHVLQTYLWQDYDLAPKFPVLTKFIDFWREKLQGNAARDRATLTELQAMGWRSLWVWECALRDKETSSDLPRALKAWIEGSEPFGAIAGPTCSAVNLEAG